MMNAVIEQDVRRDIGGDQQRIGRVETDVGALTFKHVLLPVWLAAYRYRGKSFRFVVNGRTGAVEGERPWSSGKIAALIALALIVAWLIACAPDRPGVLMRRAASPLALLAPRRLPGRRREPPAALIEATEAAADALHRRSAARRAILDGYATAAT